MAGGLQQALICTPHPGGLDIRADESHPCQGASPGSCRDRRHNLQLEADRARRAGQVGWRVRVRVRVMLTSQSLLFLTPEL